MSPIRAGRTGSTFPRRKWPWLHWCLFDAQCREWGNPRRIYIHPLRIFIDVGPDEQGTLDEVIFDRRMDAAEPAELIDPPE